MILVNGRNNNSLKNISLHPYYLLKNLNDLTILGLGSIGKRHLNTLLKLKDDFNINQYVYSILISREQRSK